MLQTIDKIESDKIYSVSRLNSEAKLLLEKNFPFVWVEGEISNFAAPNSGHWYFSLKDASAQVRCALFRGSRRKLDFIPKDGMHVLIKARVSLYENRGEFQLIAEDIEERGEGKLQRAFELLKKKLHAAGLFNPDCKKAIPTYPKQIGVITSQTGAAIRDILTVLKRRFPCVPIIIYPTLVQGATAAPAIAAAIQAANRRNECDVLILTRGGGSLEDLWPFNEEVVAKAIFASELPIISGVGHEIDYTIADFVADLRAPTPSAAAEIATPNLIEVLNFLSRFKQILLRLIKQKIDVAKKQIAWTSTHLSQQHPKRKLLEKMQRLDFYESTLWQLINRYFMKFRTSLLSLDHHLKRLTPLHAIQVQKNRLNLDYRALTTLIENAIQQNHTTLAQAAARLDGLSPLGTLKRGYAIAMDEENKIVHDAKQLKPDDALYVKLFKGKLHCIVKKII